MTVQRSAERFDCRQQGEGWAGCDGGAESSHLSGGAEAGAEREGDPEREGEPGLPPAAADDERQDRCGRRVCAEAEANWFRAAKTLS
ncbi:hypothetical protein [Amycolatopsis sp. NPDC004169]|uniref:hypothetical protein n=1 Tax=Amycolatopsis sp. NPDC004169 TaxID=3154453 RepID=UPI0033AD4BD9